jgi:hypothetical protein
MSQRGSRRRQRHRASKRVTRNVDIDRAQDLLERAPRACISFAGNNGPEALPVALVWHEGRYLVGSAQSADRLPRPDQEVVLLVDEGVHWFDLRAVSVRGPAITVEAPAGLAMGQTWFEVVPLTTVAWDYGELRELTDET